MNLTLGNYKVFIIENDGHKMLVKREDLINDVYEIWLNSNGVNRFYKTHTDLDKITKHYEKL